MTNMFYFNRESSDVISTGYSPEIGVRQRELVVVLWLTAAISRSRTPLSTTVDVVIIMNITNVCC